MSDPDKKAFFNWWEENVNNYEYRTDTSMAWEAACEYKQKEVENFKKLFEEEHRLRFEEFNEYKKLKEALSKTTDFIKKVSGNAYAGIDNAYDLHSEYLDYHMQKEAQKILNELKIL
jgi:Txe/YoeB family toxin of Txe-Axe toxin-antitoxin module